MNERTALLLVHYLAHTMWSRDSNCGTRFCLRSSRCQFDLRRSTDLKKAGNVALRRNLKRSFFQPDLLVNQNGTADIGAELGKVNSVVSPSNFRFPPRKDKRKKDVVKQREGEREMGKGEMERERKEGRERERRHMGETAETEGQTEISAADIHVGRRSSRDLSSPSSYPCWGLKTRYRRKSIK